MKDTTWYWAFRILLGVGVMVALLVGIIAAAGPSNVAESLNEPMSTADAISLIVGFIIGPIWDMVIAAGLASYIVWGDWRIGILTSPLHTPEPRSVFA